MQSNLANDVRLHLATLCRMYNDLGSVQRDENEESLNSMDFFEFTEFNLKHAPPQNFMKSNIINGKKQELVRLAQYERQCLDMALEGVLDEGIGASVERSLKLFVDVTDLYVVWR